MSLRYLSAGDSHGPGLSGIVEGLPAGLEIDLDLVAEWLERRRSGFGRGPRQKMEGDEVEITSGLWKGRTTGAPVALFIPNRGRKVDRREGGGLSTVPRPGHADLAGCLKYGLDEVPPIAERASARRTAMRVAIGAIAACALRECGAGFVSHTLSIGEVDAPAAAGDLDDLRERALASLLSCADAGAEAAMKSAIADAAKAGASLGGAVEVIATGVPAGLGANAASDRRLDARLAAALMGVPSAKAVEIGEGLQSCRRTGTDAQDAITRDEDGWSRPTNRAGGIEGGISNGENLVARVYCKPIPTCRAGAATADLRSGEATTAPFVRSDVCVIPVVGVIAEAVVAWEVLRAGTERFGGDRMSDFAERWGR